MSSFLGLNLIVYPAASTYNLEMYFLSSWIWFFKFL